MSQAKILFIHSDSELVMDSLNKHGAFHLSLQEGGTLPTSELSYKVQDLMGRLKEVMGRANLLIVDSGTVAEGTPSLPIKVPDWTSFVGLVDGEISQYEKEIQGLETEVQRLGSARLLYELWREYASSSEGKSSLPYLHTFKTIAPLLLYTHSKEPGDLAEALPGTSLAFQVVDTPRMFLVICPMAEKPKVLQSALEKGYSPLQNLDGMPPDFASLKEFMESYDTSLKKAEGGLKEAKLLLVATMPRMRYLSSLLSDARSILSIKEKTSIEERWSILEGYVPSKNGDSLIEELKRKLNGRMIYSLNEEHSSPRVPVKFKYPKYFGLFYTITNLYGVPSYNEINPTPILALTFPIIFGMMFGDIGHGVMLVGLGLLLYKFIKSMSKIGIYLSICGIFSSIMGSILYGEAFGKHLYPGLLITHGVEEDVMTLLTFALFVGVFHITLGLVISIANNFIQKKKVDAILVGIPRIILYIVSILVIIFYGINLRYWVGAPMYMLLTIILTFMLAKPLYEVARHGPRKGLSALGEMGLETFDTILRFVSNTVSYLRIFAMVVGHVMLMMVFYTLGDIVGGGVVGIVLAVFGNVFVVLLEGILVLAQDLRLHFYEWFSKFYEDGGVMFTPFKLSGEIPVV
jgi:vacuolar-type H+-ATPase subunit I/STV1